MEGECCRRLVKFRGLFLFITCSLLFTVVFMAVDQFSHLPRFASNEGANYYKQTYNHGANRGPHLGQKPRGNIQSKSRKLLDQFENIEDNSSGRIFTNIQPHDLGSSPLR